MDHNDPRGPIPVAQALAEAEKSARQLLEWTELPGDGPRVWRHWVDQAGTYAYQARGIVPLTSARDGLERTLHALVNDDGQPWFTGVTGRSGEDLDRVPSGCTAARVVQTRFDLGFGKERLYTQLLCVHAMGADTVVVTQRSIVASGQPGTVPAFALAPSGDVLRVVEDRLIWDHCITAPGGALLPPAADRWLTNTVRWAGLDQAERRRYLDEATSWMAWVVETASTTD